MNTFKCEVCGREIKSRRSLSFHLNGHLDQINSELNKERIIVYTIFGKEHVDSVVRDYVEEKYCCHNLPIDIVKYLSLLGVKRTSSQERSTKRYKDLYKKSIQEKFGIDNISKVDSVKLKKEKIFIEKYGEKTNLLTSEVSSKRVNALDEYYLDKDRVMSTYRKSMKTFLLKYGVDNPSKNKEVKKRISESLKDRAKKLSLEQRRSMTEEARISLNSLTRESVSSIEILIREVLDTLDISYDKNMFLFGYNYDIVFDNIIIEVNGDYFHANPEIYVEGSKVNGVTADRIWEKDRRKKDIAVSNGYGYIVIWENLIRSLDKCELREYVIKKLRKVNYEI